MPPEDRALGLLWDARRAGRFVMEFVREQTAETYGSDLMLKSAVERQLQIVGEALHQLRRVDPETAEAVPHLSQVVGFRNILVHGYAVIDDARVWDITKTHLPPLVDALDKLLAD